MIIKIKVTEENISRGWSGNSSFCPVARAMNDAGLIQPIVATFETQFGYEGTRYNKISLPVEAQSFIMDFDMPSRRALVKPFEFEIDTDDIFEENYSDFQ